MRIRLHGLSILIFALAATVPLFAQWKVITKRISKKSTDKYISLDIQFPIIVDGSNDIVRKSMNKTLGQISEVDSLLRKATEMIQRHARLESLKKGKSLNLNSSEEEPSYEQSLEYAVGINDGKLLSICFIGYYHSFDIISGTPYYASCTFDGNTGQTLQLNELLQNDYDQHLRDLMTEYIALDTSCLGSDWKSSINDISSPFYVTNYGFYLNPKGVVIYFPKYSIGMGACGVISIEIPYERLSPIINQDGPLSKMIK